MVTIPFLKYYPYRNNFWRTYLNNIQVINIFLIYLLRFTSPTHTILAFDHALNELDEEGGVINRFKRYCNMQKILSDGMIKLNFKPIDLKGYQGPIITTFHSPKDINYNFEKFYDSLKEKKCVIYPGT